MYGIAMYLSLIPSRNHFRFFHIWPSLQVVGLPFGDSLQVIAGLSTLFLNVLQTSHEPSPSSVQEMSSPIFKVSTLPVVERLSFKHIEYSLNAASAVLDYEQ